MIKKYLFSLSLFAFVLVCFSFGLQNIEAMGTQKIVAGEGCGTIYHYSTGQVYTLSHWVYHPATAGSLAYFSCDPNAIVGQRPISLNELISSPVSSIIGSSLTNPIQYIFKTYPFSQIQGNQPTLPINDPITIGHQNPSDQSNDVPVDIINGLVPAQFNTGIASSVTWPAKSIFDNITYWNQPLADTFKAFTVNTFANNNAINSKFYPLNFFTIANPMSKVPLVPITINWNAVPGASSYNFKLSVGDSISGLDTNLPQSINIPSTTNRTYTFSGRGFVTYNWSATPLNSNGTPLLGDQIIESPLASFIQPNINDPATNPYGTDPSGLPEGGLYKYSWDTIPGAVRYEIQYALSFGKIPDNTPFANNATFTDTSITTDGNPGGPISETTSVLSGNISGLYATNDDFTSGTHQFNFAASLLSQINPAVPFQSLNWRIRGIDANGNVIRKSLVQSGYIKPPVSKQPYQSGYPTWPRVAGATNYLVDVAENVSDFTKLPYLTSSEIPLAQSSQIAVNKSGGFIGGVSQLTTAAPVTNNNVFLLRRVVPDMLYDNGKITVAKFTSLLKESRFSFIEQNDSNGYYDEMNSEDPTTDYRAQDADTLTSFNSVNPSDLSGYIDALNTFYPLVTSNLGMTISSSTANTLTLTTKTPIIIVNKSTGNAKITVSSSVDRKTTTLTFGVNSNTGTGGYYSFNIVKIVFPGTGGTISSPGIPATLHPLTYNTFGPIPVIENLNGKGYTEFTKLLPGTTYYYRVRGFKDPNPQLPNSGASAFVWFPWSSVNSFTTPTGVPTSMTIGSDGSTLISPFDLQGVIPKLNILTKNIAGDGVKTFNWNPVTGASDYIINVYDNAGKLFNSYTGITGTTLPIYGLKSGVTYTYTISSENNIGKSAESKPYAFTSEVPKVDLNADKTLKAKVDSQKALMTVFNNFIMAKNIANVNADNTIKKLLLNLQSTAKSYSAIKTSLLAPVR